MWFYQRKPSRLKSCRGGPSASMAARSTATPSRQHQDELVENFGRVVGGDEVLPSLDELVVGGHEVQPSIHESHMAGPHGDHVWHLPPVAVVPMRDHQHGLLQQLHAPVVVPT